MRGKGLFVIFLIIVLCSPFVMSIGVTPASMTFVYDKNVGLDETFTLKISPSSSQTRYIDVELTDYATPFGVPDGVVIMNSSQREQFVTLSDKVLDIKKTTTLNVRVKIPPRSDVYGPNWFGIQLRERPEGEAGLFAVTTAILFRVSIDSSYPGQFLEITNFKIDNVNEGESARMYWEVRGRGEIDTPFIANLDLLSDKNENVFKRDLGGASVKKSEGYPAPNSYESLPTNMWTPGTYEGILTVKFSNITKRSSVKFNIGYEGVALENYTPTTLMYGDINEVTLNVRNLWNGQFSNVFGVISMNVPNMSEIKTTTPSQPIGPFETISLKQFIDTRSLAEGRYDALITINFDDKSESFPAQFTVAKEVVPVIEEEKKSLNTSTILIIVAGAVILLLLVLGILLFKRKGKKEDTVSTDIKQEKKPQIQQSKTGNKSH
jgi:hypothetical protein